MHPTSLAGWGYEANEQKDRLLARTFVYGAIIQVDPKPGHRRREVEETAFHRSGRVTVTAPCRG